VVASESGEVGNPGTLGMIKGGVLKQGTPTETRRYMVGVELLLKLRGVPGRPRLEGQLLCVPMAEMSPSC
jgi:hypothetical protein